MASITFDKSTGWWSIRFYAGPVQGRIKKTLCKHPGEWSKSRPPKRPPSVVCELAKPFEDQERRAKIGIETLSKEIPLGPHVDAYCKKITFSLQGATVTGVKTACKKFVEYCEGKKVKGLQAVTHTVCREWIESRLAEGAARSSIVTERSYLMPIWSEAIQDRLIIENPWLTAKVPGKPRKEVPTAWTKEEIGKLVEGSDGWLRDLLLLGVNTGIRISALLSLKWGQIDWPAGLIRVRAATSKSGRPYEVPMSPTAHDVLFRRDAIRKDTSELIFFNPETGRHYTPRTSFERIRALVEKTGVSNHGDYNHVMRRSFATIALNDGVPMEIVQRCLDHSTMAQTERAYAHVLAKRLKEGMAGFDISGGVRFNSTANHPETEAANP